MSYTFLFVALVIAVVNWIAVEKKIKILEYFAKPGTMIALLLFLLQNGAVQGDMLWFAVGAVFCLAGDVFLMLPQNLFIAGLVSFLVGHVFYVIGFNQPQPRLTWIVLVAVLLLGLGITWLYRRLAAGLAAKGQHSLKVPVLIYSLIISLMVLSALSTIGHWELLPALLASAGALFFYASDSMLAWDRFVAPLPHARLRVMVTYHLGQFGILLGAFWQWVILSN